VGTVLSVQWFRIGPDTGPREVIHAIEETLDTDMTNSAYYTFGKDTGAGDEQETPDNQQGGEKPDTSAGEVPDNQQGDMPDELPDTGAGGLAGGLPTGSAAAAVSLLAASGYGVIRRR
jgi:hypothetical protein